MLFLLWLFFYPIFGLTAKHMKYIHHSYPDFKNVTMKNETSKVKNQTPSLGVSHNAERRFIFMKAKKWISILMATSLIGLSLPVQTMQAQDANVKETKDFDSDSDFKITYDGFLQKYTGTGGDIEIPEGVISIEERAFAGCQSITSVNVPNSCHSIGEYAFEDCKNLKKINLPDELYVLGNGAFTDCVSLNNIILPPEIELIEDDVFSGCTSLTEISIPDSVTELGWGVFYGCTSLTDVRLPEGITEIGGSLFHNCTSLESITLPDSAELIQNYAFENCTSLTHITLPDSVYFIGESVFKDCTSLSSIHLAKELTSINKYAFKNCTSLSEITLPDSVMKILQSAFEGCTGLKSITFPDGVRGLNEIANYAFRNCTGLESITLPRKVHTIGSQAFDGCTNLTDIYASKYNAYFRSYEGILYNRLDTNLFCCPQGKTEAEIAFTATSIGEDAFRNCKNITKITIPEIITSIGKEAFYGHSNTLVIYGKSGSYAEIYAREHAIPFQSVGQSTKDITQCSAVLSQASYIYDGTAKTPSVTVKDQKVTLTENTDYQVSYGNNIAVGKATVYITGIGKYRGTIRLPFLIKKSETQNPSNDKAEQIIGCTKTFNKTFGDTPFALKVQTVKDSGKLSYKSSAPKIATVNANGTITVKGTGIATITVQAEATAKYKAASVKITIKVKPALQAVKSIKTVKGKKLAVQWKKDANATGYQIQCCLDRSFKKGVKTLNITKNNIASGTFSKLKNGKNYYVRARSYKKTKANGKTQNLYSAWSKPKKSKSIRK